MASVEVITSVGRRRWSRDEKLRVVAESAQAGRTASQVARDLGIAPGQLFHLAVAVSFVSACEQRRRARLRAR
jgi:transposase